MCVNLLRSFSVNLRSLLFYCSKVKVSLNISCDEVWKSCSVDFLHFSVGFSCSGIRSINKGGKIIITVAIDFVN